MVPNAPISDDQARTLTERLNALLWRLQATRRVWRRGASPDTREPEPEAVEVEFEEAVPRGTLDLPGTSPVVPRGPVTFHGWSLFPSGPTAKVEVWLGEEQLGRARIGVPRPDVSSSLGLSPSEAPGFELTTNLLGWPGEDGETELRVVATSFAGERLEIEPLPLRVAGGAITGPTSPASEHTPAVARKPGLRTMVVTHQLDRGGAQLYLMDLLRELMRIEAVNPTVVAGRDGPLRAELEELGVPVHISGVAPAEGLSAHLGRVEELAAWAADREFEVAFVNTGTSLIIPGVEVAGRLGIPAVWAIHESYEPSRLWDDVDGPVRERAERALAEVAQPLFVAEATQRLFEPLNRWGLTIPYGLDLEPIDSRRAGFDRDSAREAAGIPLDAEVVLCVGSVEPRKAQVPLAQAFDRIAGRHPRARLIVVGGRDDGYSHFLAGYAASSAAAERISIVPMTTDVQPWYGISDLAAGPSDVESMPRTALEAMAWEVPVLATNIFGLPELIEDGENGWLCEPRDLTALAAALERALTSTPEERRRIGRAGRALVEQRHSLEAYGREIGALLERVASGDRGKPLADAAAR
jgi:glycosyltransferase involved in cell wall biosynthesis